MKVIWDSIEEVVDIRVCVIVSFVHGEYNTIVQRKL